MGADGSAGAPSSRNSRPRIPRHCLQFRLTKLADDVARLRRCSLARVGGSALDEGESIASMSAACQQQTSKRGKLSLFEEREEPGNSVPFAASRTEATPGADSTSWGSLVRAQCRPPRKALETGPFALIGAAGPRLRGTRRGTVGARNLTSPPGDDTRRHAKDEAERESCGRAAAGRRPDPQAT